MGTLLSIVTIIAAFVLMVVPFGPHFYGLAGVLVLLWLAALTRPQAGWFSAATLIAGFSALAIAPFEAPRRFLNGFRRIARGERPEAEAAQRTFDFYTQMADFAWLLDIGLIAIIIAAAVVAARRAADGTFAFYLSGSDGLGEFAVRMGKIASILFLPMIIIIFYDVVQRKYLEFDPGFADSWMFQTFTSTKLQEMQWHLHAVLFLMCLGFAYIKDAHVRIELVRDRLRPRSRVWIELLGCLVFLLPYCFLIYTYGFEFAYKSWEINEVSAALTGLPYRFIIKGFLPIGFLLLAIAGASVFLRCLVYLFGPPGLQAQSSYYAGTHHADIPQDVPHEEPGAETAAPEGAAPSGAR